MGCCRCEHVNTVPITEGVRYCLCCKQHVQVRKVWLDDRARVYAPTVALLKQRHRPPPEEVPELSRPKDNCCGGNHHGGHYQ